MEFVNGLGLLRDRDALFESSELGDLYEVQVDPVIKGSQENAEVDINNGDQKIENIEITRLAAVMERGREKTAVLLQHLTEISKFVLNLRDNIGAIESSNRDIMDRLERDGFEFKDLQEIKREFENKLLRLEGAAQMRNQAVSGGPAQGSYMVVLELVERMRLQKLQSQAKVNQFSSKFYELEKLIQEKEHVIYMKDTQIEQLEQKMEDTIGSMENEFRCYETKILDLVKKFELDKSQKNKKWKDEIKKKLEFKKSRMMEVMKENASMKEQVCQLTAEKTILTKDLSKMKDYEQQDVIVQDLQKKVSVLAEENHNLILRNSFQNQSIKDLLKRIKELQIQVKNIEIKSTAHFLRLSRYQKSEEPDCNNPEMSHSPNNSGEGRNNSLTEQCNNVDQFQDNFHSDNNQMDHQATLNNIDDGSSDSLSLHNALEDKISLLTKTTSQCLRIKKYERN